MHFVNRSLHGVVLRHFAPSCLGRRTFVQSLTSQHNKLNSKQIVSEGPSFPLRSRPKRKKRPEDPSFREAITLTKRLSYLLRHGAEAQGLNIRPDGWVPLDDVLKHSSMAEFSFEHLRQVLQLDPQRRIVVKEVPISKDASMWWIRAAGKHSIPSVNTAMKQIKYLDQVSAVLYCTNWAKWNNIKKYGIWPDEDDSLIHFVQSVDEDYGVEAHHNSAHHNSAEIVIQLDLEKALLAGLQFFIKNDRSVVTAGDYRGCVGSDFIYRVSQISWNTRILQGKRQGQDG
ncbi:hypothetical protein K435DRAFT_780022 [Dendrothele bispora CBS 962.96]|uniref:2'-phosphotransferase n=1 Tax=Dendrothele bispora (strain CBS 962.96) TaxID=1314807 RepID=A0A4S8LVA3_DENBC|nr:hypothetical protein K435DRAFT_780022 [Dendrothele bispora CBS 962.96]